MFSQTISSAFTRQYAFGHRVHMASLREMWCLNKGSGPGTFSCCKSGVYRSTEDCLNLVVVGTRKTTRWHRTATSTLLEPANPSVQICGRVFCMASMQSYPVSNRAHPTRQRRSCCGIVSNDTIAAEQAMQAVSRPRTDSKSSSTCSRLQRTATYRRA